MALHVVVVCSTYQPRPAAGDSWAASIMVAEELPHLYIQPVAEAWTADRSLVSKRTRQRVCHEWFKVAMVPAQYLHSSGEHTAHSCTWAMSGAHECGRSRTRQQALHCGHSGKGGRRGRRVATGLGGYGACEAAVGVVQKSGEKDESSRSGTTLLNGRRGREKKSKSDPHCWRRKVCRISFHTHVQHVMAPPSTAQAPDASVLILRNLSLSGDLRRFSTSQSGRVG